MIYFLIIVIILLIIFSGILIWFLLNLNDVIFELQIQIEESLNILDFSYRKISIVLETPVMSDEPFVKQVLNDIKTARDAIILISKKIVIFEDDENER